MLNENQLFKENTNLDTRICHMLMLSRGLNNIPDPLDSLDDLRFDSLDIIESVMYLERSLNVDISDDDVTKWHKIEDVIKTFKNEINKRVAHS